MNNLKPYKFRDNGPLDFYDMIDGFFNNSARDVDFLKSSSFKVDIEEKDNSFIVSAEVPGYEKDEINISLDEGKLTLSLEKKEENSEENKNFIHRERRFSKMSRTMYFKDIDDENIKAKLDKGVLEIDIPKKPEVISKRKLK